MENLLKEYENYLQAIYDKHVGLFPDSETVVPDKIEKYLNPFRNEFDTTSEKMGKLLVSKLAFANRNEFVAESVRIYGSIYQQYKNRLEDVKTGKSDTENAIFQP